MLHPHPYPSSKAIWLVIGLENYKERSSFFMEEMIVHY